MASRARLLVLWLKREFAPPLLEVLEVWAVTERSVGGCLLGGSRDATARHYEPPVSRAELDVLGRRRRAWVSDES
jgi:hypothetical protein